MDIPQRKIGDVVILEPAGRMTIGEADHALKQAVSAAAEADAAKLLINLGDVTYMDSATLGELLSTRQTMSERGGSLRICGLQPRVRTLLELTGLLSALDVHDSEAEALEAFAR